MTEDALAAASQMPLETAVPAIKELQNTVSEVGSSGHDVLSTIAGVFGIEPGSLSLVKIVLSVLMLVVLIMLSRIASKIAGHAIIRSRMNEGLKKFIIKVIRFILYFLSLMIFADSIGIPITSLLALFSLLGLAISLSIQNLLGNIMSGITILMVKPFDIGDYIETDIAGTVDNIGLFYTEITTVDNKKVYIPNEKIVADRLVNYNSETKRRIDVKFNAAYKCDIETVKTALREAVRNVPWLLDEPEPIIGVAEYGASSILYDVRVWTKTEDYFKARYALMDEVSRCYKKHGVEMAYNRLEVEVLNERQK